MLKSLRTALIVVVILMIGAIGTIAVLYQKYRQTSTNYAEMKVAEETARTHYTEAFNAIAEIQDSLNAIAVTEGSVSMRPQNLAAERKLTETNRQEVMESIALLNTSIQRTKDRIGQLETRLKKSGMRAAGLEKMVARLKTSVAEKETEVAQLSGQVDQLKTQVTGLETTVAQDQETIQAKNQTIEEKRRELGTVYYVIGTKKELAQSGLIVSKGGVLGLGKTVQLSGRYDDHLFTALDTDQESVIRTPATKKVKVLSPQPVSSYELTVEGNQIAIHILDPVEFRKVKHVVIMTA